MAIAREILETLFQSSPHMFCVTQLFCHLHKNSDLKRKKKKPSSNRWCAGGCWLAPITNRWRGCGGKRIADICSWVTHLWYNQAKAFKKKKEIVFGGMNGTPKISKV